MLVPSPIYHNFYATPVWKQRRAMLEREREAIGVAAELTGMFAASVASGLHQLAEDYDADLLVVGSSGRGRSWWGHVVTGRCGGWSSEHVVAADARGSLPAAGHTAPRDRRVPDHAGDLTAQGGRAAAGHRGDHDFTV